MKKNKEIFLSDLNRFFKKLFSNKDHIIVFQTEIIPTAVFYRLSGKFISTKIFNYIEKYYSDKTILFPAFSNDFVNKKKYDVRLSKPNTGIIPNIALLSKRYNRTESPIHSFLIKGPLAKDACSLFQETTWGNGSVYRWLYENNAKWISFNLRLNRGCAIHHMSEEIAKVPYRFYKTFKGNILINKKILHKNFKEKKYSYYLRYRNKLNYNKWPKFMRKNRDYTEVFFSNGLFANIFLVKKIVDRSIKYYQKYPYGSLDI